MAFFVPVTLSQQQMPCQVRNSVNDFIIGGAHARERVDYRVVFRDKGIYSPSDNHHLKIIRKGLLIKLVIVDVLDTTAKTKVPSRITRDVRGIFTFRLYRMVRPQRIIWLIPTAPLD